MKKKAADGTLFSSVIEELMAVERAYVALNTPKAMKLTPQAYVSEALRVAGVSPDRLSELRTKVEQPATFDMSEIAAALRRMVVMVRSPNFPAPPRELRRVRHALTPAADVALVQIGANSFELFALAAMIAAEKYPDDFGECNSSSEYDRRMLELGVRRAELQQRISDTWQPQDVATSPPDKDGRVKLTFLWNGVDTGVAVYPHDGAGERLTNHLFAVESARR